jgi:hypothetical protein
MMAMAISTGSYRSGGLIAGILVTLYAVAGTATQI